MPTNRPAASTTGTPLMACSESNFATASTDVLGSTVITFAVMTSIARIPTPRTGFSEEYATIGLVALT
jgi:hypothetical protein